MSGEIITRVGAVNPSTLRSNLRIFCGSAMQLRHDTQVGQSWVRQVLNYKSRCHFSDTNAANFAGVSCTSAHDERWSLTVGVSIADLEHIMNNKDSQCWCILSNSQSSPTGYRCALSPCSPVQGLCSKA